MKRLFQIFIVACALTACENDKPGYEPSIERKPIVFDMTETRAAIESSNIEEYGFGVYAFVTNEANTAYESLFGNSPERVSFENGSWTYTNTKYWLDNRTYQFFGIYPCDESYSITTDLSGNPNGISRTFTTPDTADEDLVLARATYDTSVATPESVAMNFEHMLAKVYFKVHYDTVGNEDDKFTLKEFSISNIKQEGTLQSPFNSTTVSWSANPLQNIEFKWEGEYMFGNELSLWQDGLMLIPQTISPGVVNIRVKYIFVDKYVDKDGEHIADPVEKVVDTFLPAITWSAGQQYTYTMTLHEDDLITFKQIEVATWGSPQQGGAIIIK